MRMEMSSTTEIQLRRLLEGYIKLAVAGNTINWARSQGFFK